MLVVNPAAFSACQFVFSSDRLFCSMCVDLKREGDGSFRVCMRQIVAPCNKSLVRRAQVLGSPRLCSSALISYQELTCVVNKSWQTIGFETYLGLHAMGGTWRNVALHPATRRNMYDVARIFHVDTNGRTRRHTRTPRIP